MREGYIVVAQDMRGRYMSEGEFKIIPSYILHKKTKMDVDEASDAYDAIDWLVKNVPGNNEKVGVVGISYPGFSATEASLSVHPALLAVSPQAPTTDAFMGDDVHHNGAFFLADTYGFIMEFGVGTFGTPGTTLVQVVAAGSGCKSQYQKPLVLVGLI